MAQTRVNAAAVAAGTRREGGPWLDAAEGLHAWMLARDYRGHDPHDFLASPLLGRLTFGSRWLGVAWIQLGKRSPGGVRRLLRVPALRNAKGVGLVVGACARLYTATGDARWRDEGQALVGWLAGNGHRAAGGIGWGYPFAWANRDFHAPAGTPSSVATAFVGHALLDAAEAWGDEQAVRLATEGALWLAGALNRIPGEPGFAFSYTPVDRRVVHNASVLAASLLARVAARSDQVALAADALAAARFTAAAQGADGAWPYGLGRRNAWVDSFHTSYTLVALHAIGTLLGTPEFERGVQRGARYWLDTFLAGPAVTFYPGRRYPIDVHAVAHAILALRALRGYVPDAHARAQALGHWALDVMRDGDGSFYYQQSARGIDRARYMRWTQAWMLSALAELAAWEAA
jgi:polysaccharide biosynthesis protein VpsJ